MHYVLCNLCTMHYALCTMHYALCTMYYALCTMHYALCTMHYALCTMHYATYALCTMHYALCTMHYALCPHCLHCPYPPLEVAVVQGAVYSAVDEPQRPAGQCHLWQLVLLLPLRRVLIMFSVGDGRVLNHVQCRMRGFSTRLNEYIR
ncbi:hypothetical protein B484DRAFT_356954 [Ochromonadaceae sp. CCMP2298]|nr:hypothetical protein B484DRAFT_356954 [Ochromonadaceae sp. CCMP2298]